MHEATVAMAILNRAMQSFDRQADTAACRITKIVVDIGEFRNIDPESLDFAFSALRKDFQQTEDAQLEIRRIDALAICNGEKHVYSPQPDQYYACTKCGGGIDKLIRGEELDIKLIELSDKSTNMEETHSARSI